MSDSGGSILFCTPMYGGMCFKPYFESSLRLAYALTEMGIEHEFLTGRNESLVTRARNEMTYSFLKSHYTHMMWIDADMEFKVDDVARVWNLVCESRCDIAVAAYTMKRDDLPLSAWKDGKLITWDEFPDEPFEVDLAGTGFMIIPRYVVEKCAEDAEKYQGPYGEVPALYMTPVHDGGLESEDYHLCRIAREAGFSIWCDPASKPGHWGQARYGGHMPESGNGAS